MLGIMLRKIQHEAREQFPEHSILAEEADEQTVRGENLWIIDPLDGTTNYIHGYPQFSVSIGLQQSGRMVLGVIFDPVRDELFTAARGRGAFLNGKAVQISPVAEMKEGLLTTGFPFRQKDKIEPYLHLFREVFNSVSDLRRAGSAALDLAHLASGRCDGFFEIGLSPWDIAVAPRTTPSCCN